MGNFKDLTFVYCERDVAKRVCDTKHYMRTYPSGAKVNVAMMDGKRLVGIAVFGYSSQTDKKVLKVAYGIDKTQYLEMQRLWISDDYGHNTESYVLSKIIKMLERDMGLRMIVTHAGGCKDDCGIVYQASGWLYFGGEPCNDFYLTEAGEYKNIIAPIRFGRVDAKGKTQQQVGEELFGPGEIIYAHRYFYVYPIEKSIRRRLGRESLPYPKQSATFRKDQKWVSGELAGASDASRGGSNPSLSTIGGSNE